MSEVSYHFNQGDIIEVRAKPKSSKSLIEWDEEHNKFNAFLKSIPADGRANSELIKLFKKQLKINVEQISGFKGKDKKYRVI